MAYQVIKTIQSTDPTQNGAFPINNRIAVAGSDVFIGDSAVTANGLTGAGQILVYNTTTNTLLNPLQFSGNPSQNESLGSAPITGVGNTVFIGDPNATVNGLTKAGQILVYSTITNRFLNSIQSGNPVAGQALGSSPNTAVIGNNLYIGDPNATVNGLTKAGQILVYNTSTNVLANFIQSNNITQNDQLGSGSIAALGNNLYIGDPNATVNGLTQAGQILVYNTSTNILTNSIQSDNTTQNDRLGTGSITAVGNNLYIGDPNATVNGLTNAGQILVYNTSTNTFLNPILSSTPSVSGSFGRTKIAVIGTNIYIGDPFVAANGLSGAGEILVYNTLTNTISGSIQSSNPSQQENLGNYPITASGTTLFIGDPNATVNSLTNAGQILVYDTTTKTFLTPIISTNPTANESFGSQQIILAGADVVAADPKATVNGLTQSGQVLVYNNNGTSQGDVHLATFDGIHYDFQGVGEFTLVKSTTDDLEVQTRQQPWNGDPTTTVNTAVAIKIGGENINLYLGLSDTLVVNDSAVNLSDGSSYVVGTDTITRTGNSYNILSANKDKIQVTIDSSFLNVNTTLAANRQGNVVGLLGNDNGKTSDDFALRDGTVLGSSISNQELNGEYADSWRITQATSLFHYEGQVDYLTGLSNSKNSSVKDYDLTYNGGPLSTQSKHSSYAILENWQKVDQISLNKSITDYVLGNISNLNGHSGTGIYQDLNHNGKVDSTDNLIALVINSTGLALSNTSQFHY